MELLTKKIRETETNREFLSRFDQVGVRDLMED
jgi:hypothetical protein